METKHNMKSYQAGTKFKSYYVVWKPKNPALTAIGMYGLNRTMQYGNVRGGERSDAQKNRLNRTMQYGNAQNGGQRVWSNDV